MKSIDYWSKIHDDSNEFFNNNGSAKMYLTCAAAMQVCQHATVLGRVVGRIEGGIWNDNEFEARLDCIWDVPDNYDNDCRKSNELARQFVKTRSANHNAFVISLAKRADKMSSQ